MKIIIERYMSTQAQQARAESLRQTGHEDIIVMTKEAGAHVGVVLSASFDQENLNQDAIAAHGVEVASSEADFGAAGSLISVPENTFTMHVPLSDALSVGVFFDAILRACESVGAVAQGNDIVIGGKKFVGVGVFSGQLVAMGAMRTLPSWIDEIYTDEFFASSGKARPSQRVGGFGADMSIRRFFDVFAEALCACGVEVSAVIEEEKE